MLIKGIFIAVLAYGLSYKQLYFSSSHYSAKDIALVKVAQFLASYQSPLQHEVAAFVDAADKNKLPYYLLPIVSCVESSCGKFYRRNAFGWNSDRDDFGSNRQDIYAIAHKIATLPYYKKFRETKSLYDFAVAYNGKYAQDYYKKLMFFYGRYMQ